MTAPARRDFPTRLMTGLTSPVLNTVVGIAGIAIPVVAWANANVNLKNGLLAVETALLLLLVTNHLWLRKAFIQLRRADRRQMADGHFFDLVRARRERDLIAGFQEIADGHIQVYGAEVPRLALLLFDLLIESRSEPRQILTTDLTTDADLLTQRREYLTAARKITEAGCTIQRLFIAWRDDLTREDFAQPLLFLVDHHRSLGMQCGLAVRDRLRADQAVDFVLLSRAAVLVQEEQSDTHFAQGRSSVYFKQIDRWAERFTSLWGHGEHGASFTLQTYEATVRPMLNGGIWEPLRARTAVDRL